MDDNEDLITLCTKYGISSEIGTEISQLFEDQLIKLFRKTVGLGPPQSQSQSQSQPQSNEICKGRKANGEACTYKSKNNGYCARHDPNKAKTAPVKASSVQPRARKKATASGNCHAKTTEGKQCSLPGATKPDGSDFYYCKRHADKWENYEPKYESDLVDRE